MADVGRITFGPDYKLDTSAGGHPERTYVGKETTVADLHAEIARLRAENERLKNESEARQRTCDTLAKDCEAYRKELEQTEAENERLKQKREIAKAAQEIGGEIIVKRMMEAEAQAAACVGALNECAELFGVIRDDYTDPRSECREGKALIAETLATLPTRAADLLAVVEAAEDHCCVAEPCRICAALNALAKIDGPIPREPKGTAE